VRRGSAAAAAGIIVPRCFLSPHFFFLFGFWGRKLIFFRVIVPIIYTYIPLIH
jgi:hypothetical protein